MKDQRRQGLCGPHLASNRHDGHGDSQHFADLAAPGPGGDDQGGGPELISLKFISIDQYLVSAVPQLVNAGDFEAGQDAGPFSLSPRSHGAGGLLRVGLGPQRRIHQAQQIGIQAGLDASQACLLLRSSCS